MMLVCPSCAARYMVSEGAVGSAGRKVRCANCGHEWFEDGPAEEPMDEEVLEAFEGLTDEEDDGAEIDLSMLENVDVGMDEEEPAPAPAPEAPADEEEDISIAGEAETEIAVPDAPPPEQGEEEDTDISTQPGGGEEAPEEEEPIPDSVKPIPEGAEEGSPIAGIEQTAAAQDALKKRLAGYGAAGGVFLCLIGLMLLLKGPIFSVFPGSALLYNMFGMDVELPAQGLVVEKLTAEFKEENGVRAVLMKGRVINLKSKDRDVPLILATLRAEDGSDLESWIVDPPYQVLAAEQSFDFEASYPGLPEEAYSINLQFAPYMNKGDLVSSSPDHHEEEGHKDDHGHEAGHHEDAHH